MCYDVIGSYIERREMRRTKPMKLPNGFGQISLLKSNLRNPYRVMVTVGTNQYGKPICKILKPQGYFATYNEAYMALIKYNENPYEIKKDITFKELYEDWLNTKTDISEGCLNLYTQGFKHLANIHDMKVVDIKPKVIRQEIEKYRHLTRGPRNIKTVLNYVLDYAVENEIVDKNYARLTKISTEAKTKNQHISFTDEEIKTLWKYQHNDTVKMILIQCYTGLRPGELTSLQVKNINLEENIIIGGSKTEAGRNRRIPIHPGIKEFLNYFLKIATEKNFDFLFNNSNSEKVRIEWYRRSFKNIIKELGLNPDHKAHDPRKFFVTQAKMYELNEYAIKLIVGHAIRDITESVYTERKFDWLYSEICKIQM